MLRVGGLGHVVYRMQYAGFVEVTMGQLGGMGTDLAAFDIMRCKALPAG